MIRPSMGPKPRMKVSKTATRHLRAGLWTAVRYAD